MVYNDQSTYAKFLRSKCVEEGHSEGCGCKPKNEDCGCCPPGLVAVYDQENGKQTACLTPEDAAQLQKDKKDNMICPDGYVKLVNNSTGEFLGCVTQDKFAELNEEINGSGHVNPTGLDVVTSGDEVGVGLSIQAYAIFEPRNTTDQSVTWTSTDASKASITSNGVITGIATGSTTIKATSVADNTIIGFKTITVTT